MSGEIDGSFKIKSGQGISQAIRDELGLSDEQNKKLGLSVWTQILNCVKKENDERNEGDKIYTGGSDIKGDYRTNFVVKANQLIELSAETWNKIVDLVNSKLNTSIDKVEQEGEAPASAGENGGGSQEEVKTVNTAIINDGEDHSAIESEKPEDLTSDEIKILNRKVYTGTFPRKDEIVHIKGGRYYKNKFLIEEHDPNDKLILQIDRNNDGSIKSIIKYQYDESGNEKEKYVYDENGKVKEKLVDTDPNNKIYEEKYFYDANGKVKEKLVNTDFSNGYYEEKYVYDDKGNVKEKYFYDENGNDKEKYVYENGKVKEKWVNTNFSNNYFEEKYVYDDKGNVKEKHFYDENGKVKEKYVYDENGNDKEKCVYDENGKVKEKYVYDENGNDKEKCVYDENGKVKEKCVYDENGKVKEKWVDTDPGNGYYDENYVYDENGKVKEKWVDIDPGNGYYEEKYVYDENGKVKEKWVGTDPGNEYYDEKYVYDENGEVKERYNRDMSTKEWVRVGDS